jgi:probable rRNA maturation factor
LDAPYVELDIDWSLDTDPLVNVADAAGLITHALRTLGATGTWSFAARYVDDLEMCRLHERYLGDPSPTDIMTFPYDPEDGARGGDILISVDTAAANAAEQGWSTREELAFLLLHGLLHILGWDDHSAESRRAMLDRQREILATWNPSGPSG